MSDLILVEENITFKQWIVDKRWSNNPRGDLARDIFSDPNFPDTHDYSEMIDYLNYKQACKEAKDTFRYAYKTFMKLKKGLD
ncbi:YozE family protein [Clostridium sp. C2-6-12]|uniref:YozE family protein n=1 Tax=Clostridium sp. C2-6-12 TaxID=2698832 RepID=UPI00136E3D08|nr:YozE family protein [Clostridium sp. C2-6-12]